MKNTPLFLLLLVLSWPSLGQSNLQDDIRCDSIFCVARWTLNRPTAKKLYDAMEWEKLFELVQKTGDGTNLVYFYLGRAAEEVGSKEDAIKYYSAGLAARDCKNKLSNCDDLFPLEEKISARLATLGSVHIEANFTSVNNLKKSDRGNDPINDSSSILAKRSIYFDLDSFIVKADFSSVIEVHSQYLIAHPDRKVIIQGNTDERGVSEYNLALGQKRAEAVRRTLSLLGVPDGQMEAVSFGKEKPKATGRDESAWAENRRVDIAY